MTQCPVCLEQTLNEDLALNAVSRRDNETYICTSCGESESNMDLIVAMANL